MYVKRIRAYRIMLIILLIVNVVFLGYYYVHYVMTDIPDNIRVYVGNESEFDFGMPATGEICCSKEVLNISNASTEDRDRIHFSLMEPFTVQADKKGSYNMALRLFGIFDLKTVSLEVIDRRYLTPCGNAIGIRVDTDGLLVLGTGTVTGIDGLEYEPAYRIIRTGDYITEVNDKKVTSIKRLQQLLQKTKKHEVYLTIRRNDVESKIKLPTVASEDGTNKLGVWVRENTQGIGTLTYINDNSSYGALGHGITDSDTGVLMDVGKGHIYNTDILQIVKGENGSPGELMGMILETSSQMIGSINDNTPFGISGKLNPKYNLGRYEAKAIPVGLKQEIKEGKATIMCQIDDEVNEYEVEIVDINRGSKDNKGLVVQVTDPELIERTGGIIQGMSGSPIIQDGKIIGAVTHVFVNDPTKGYGIFIETMLEH